MFGSEPVLSQTRVALQVIGIILAVAAALWMLQQLERVFLLLMLATLLAYVVDPLVQLGERPVWIGGVRVVSRAGPPSRWCTCLSPVSRAGR